MSVILIPEATGEEDERATYIPVEPGDPFVEALRTAREMEAEIVFLEPASHEKPHLNDTYPEPYAIEMIGTRQLSGGISGPFAAADPAD